MNRRRFLGFLGVGAAAVAAEQVIPFNRVWSFPRMIVPAGSLVLPPGASVRFLRVWDMLEARMLSRLDVAYGFPLALPVLAECAQVDRNTTNAPLIWHPPAHVPRELVTLVREEGRYRSPREHNIFGAWMKQDDRAWRSHEPPLLLQTLRCRGRNPRALRSHSLR